MAIRPILRIGDPFLLREARPVDPAEIDALAPLIADMKETMQAANGAGLAAPQIGVGLRVVLFGFDDNPRYAQAPPVPETVLINPHIEVLDAHRDADWEGCLSVPGMRGQVLRYRRIRYSGLDADGYPVNVEADGFHARVVQHECDHLDGILYTQRLSDPRMFGFIEELASAGLLQGQPCDD